MSRISRPSSGPNTTRSPAATTRSTTPLTRTPTPDNLAGRTWTRPAPPSVVNASRPRATSRTPELTRRSTPRSWSHAPQRRSSAWPTSGPGTTTTARAPWVRTAISRWSSMPLRTGTGHVSAGCPGSGSSGGSDRQTATGSHARRPPGRVASCRSSRTCTELPTRTVGTDWEGATRAISPRAVADPRHNTAPRSSPTAAKVRGDSSVPAPGISVGRLHTAVAVPSAAASERSGGEPAGVGGQPAVAARHGDGEGPSEDDRASHRPSGTRVDRGGAGNDHGDQYVEAHHPEREMETSLRCRSDHGLDHGVGQLSGGGDRRQPRRRRRHPPPPLAVDRGST